jgi:hypothetical protein
MLLGIDAVSSVVFSLAQAFTPGLACEGCSAYSPIYGAFSKARKFFRHLRSRLPIHKPGFLFFHQGQLRRFSISFCRGLR